MAIICSHHVPIMFPSCSHYVPIMPLFPARGSKGGSDPLPAKPWAMCSSSREESKLHHQLPVFAVIALLRAMKTDAIGKDGNRLWNLAVVVMSHNPTLKWPWCINRVDPVPPALRPAVPWALPLCWRGTHCWSTGWTARILICADDANLLMDSKYHETWNIMNIYIIYIYIIWISWIKIVQQLGWPTCPLIPHRPLHLAAHPPVQKPFVMPFGIQASGGVQSWPKLAENSPLLKTFWVLTCPCYMSIPCWSRSCLIDSSTHIRYIILIHYQIHSVIQIIDAISTATICYNIYPVAHLRHFPLP